MNSPEWVRKRKEFRDGAIVDAYKEVLRVWEEVGHFDSDGESGSGSGSGSDGDFRLEIVFTPDTQPCSISALPENTMFTIVGYEQRGVFSKAPPHSMWEGREFNAVRITASGEDGSISFERWFFPESTRVKVRVVSE